MIYSVKQLAEIAEVSIRTLHFYDQIGLLTPSRKDQTKYRQYQERDLLRLQQILFFRELEFKISDIKNILNSPKFDEKQALKEQRKMLETKRKRINKILRTIDRTIQNLNHQTTMKDEELYEGLSKKEIAELSAESKRRWGNTSQYKQSETRMKKMSKDEWNIIKEEGDTILKNFAKLIDHDINSKEVQELVKAHYNHLKNFYEPTIQMYRGLAQMYIADTRFKAYFEKYHPDLPKFIHDAMQQYCDLQDKK